ncbi:MAG TPA: RNA polymerase subunit sigma-24, partial [Verrucomicrobiota bacterium]|nr:RNA polymerase subunit sigma-24 [Verrucomicrobiota bacterium]
MPAADSCPPGFANGREFPATHWSVVLGAARAEDPRAARAWEELCRNYWYPLYAYLRRDGCKPEEAQDLTQGFIASLIEKQELRGVRPGLGKFRSFLLGTLRHYRSDVRR